MILLTKSGKLRELYTNLLEVVKISWTDAKLVEWFYDAAMILIMILTNKEKWPPARWPFLSAVTAL